MELSMYNIDKVKITERKHRTFSVYSVTVTGKNHWDKEYETEIKLFSDDTSKSFNDLVGEVQTMDMKKDEK